MKYTVLKIDVSFPDLGAKNFIKLLEEGWTIFDKSVVGDRYIFYILKKTV